LPLSKYFVTRKFLIPGKITPKEIFAQRGILGHLVFVGNSLVKLLAFKYQ